MVLVQTLQEVVALFLVRGVESVLHDGSELRRKAGPPVVSIPGGLALKQIAEPQPGFPDSVGL